MANIFFLGGILSKEELVWCNDNKVTYDSAAHNFQKKFLKGFSEPFTMINAPFISYDPTHKMNRVSIETQAGIMTSAQYLNIKYLRNIFKFWALKDIVKNIDFTDAIVFSYSVHTPFLRTLDWIKKKYPSARIVQIIPDLPQFMNTTNSPNFMYRMLKSVDIKTINSLLCCVDLFVPFTETMIHDYLNIYQKPYYVMEGVYEERQVHVNNQPVDDTKRVVYTGTLNVRYGITKLIEAFSYNGDPKIKLYICGDGELRDKLEKVVFPNVVYLGMLPYDKAMEQVDNADLLVNPREGDEVYTRYSFPSKIFDYLSSDRPILCFKLPGIPAEYDMYLSYFESADPREMMEQIAHALQVIPSKRGAKDFLKTRTAERHIESILSKLK